MSCVIDLCILFDYPLRRLCFEQQITYREIIVESQSQKEETQKLVGRIESRANIKQQQSRGYHCKCIEICCVLCHPFDNR